MKLNNHILVVTVVGAVAILGLILLILTQSSLENRAGYSINKNLNGDETCPLKSQIEIEANSIEEMITKINELENLNILTSEQASNSKNVLNQLEFDYTSGNWNFEEDGELNDMPFGCGSCGGGSGFCGAGNVCIRPNIKIDFGSGTIKDAKITIVITF